MNSLILVRHGQSRWNSSNKFTGWVDVTLSVLGIKEAEECGERLKDTPIDVAFTSELIRAQQTLFTILSKQNKTGIVVHVGDTSPLALVSNVVTLEDIPIYETHRLNERHYGILQGQDKAEVREKFGEEQVMNWRRGYKAKPPEGESLEDVFRRAVPYFKNTIMPYISSGKNVIVSGHGNSLRAIVKYIENITDDQIVNLDIPTGEVVMYEFDGGRVSKRKGELSFKRKVYWSPWVQKNEMHKN